MEVLEYRQSSIVIHVKWSEIVVKTFAPLDKDQDPERRIHEHLQSEGQKHPNIPQYFGKSSEDLLVQCY